MSVVSADISRMAAPEEKKDLTSQSPIVSVLMPAYNAEKSIAAAIDSARRQTLSDIEVIICNDDSQDRTETIIREIAQIDPRVKVVNNPHHSGISFARNVTLQNARGRWIAFLDADDLMHSRRLETLVNLGERHHADVVVDNLIWIDADANKHAGPAVRNIAEDLPLSSVTFISRSSNIGFSWGYLQPLIKTEFIQQHKMFFDINLKTGVDFHFLCGIFIAGACGIFTPRPMYYYRQHPQSITALQDNRGKNSFDQLISGTQKLLELAKYQGNVEADAALHSRLEFLIDMRSFVEVIGALRTRDFVSAIQGIKRKKFRFLRFFFYRAWQKLVWELRWQFATPFKLDL